MTTTLLQRLTDTVRYWSARRKSVQALSALDDSQLKDIGIHRSEISRAVKERIPPPHAPLLRRRSTERPPPIERSLNALMDPTSDPSGPATAAAVRSGAC